MSTKVSQLTQDTSPSSDDYLMTVDNATGASRKATIAHVLAAGGAGTGSVTSVSVTTANGVSGSVATATTTPAISLSLGAIIPTSVAASGSVTGSNLSGTNTGDQDLSTYYHSGGTDVAVADGGTGASTAAAARTNLGLVIGTNVQAWDADLDTWATKTAPSGAAVGTTDTQTLTNKTLTSPAITTPSGLVKGDVGLGNVDNTSDATERAATRTVSNMRVTRRVGTTASSGTPTINTDNTDKYRITALAVAITSFTTNLTGTPVDGDTLWISITDNGTAHAIAWGASFEASGNVALPTTTVISTRLDVLFAWNAATSKWRVVAVA